MLCYYDKISLLFHYFCLFVFGRVPFDDQHCRNFVDNLHDFKNVQQKRRDVYVNVCQTQIKRRKTFSQRIHLQIFDQKEKFMYGGPTLEVHLNFFQRSMVFSFSTSCDHTLSTVFFIWQSINYYSYYACYVLNCQ